MSIQEFLVLFGIPASITTLLFFILRKYFGTKIDTAFKKNIEKYKQELLVATEHSKFDFQRKIQDFNLFTSKKHEVYGELNKLLLIAENYITGLFGFRTELSYEEFDKIDLKKVMENSGFPNGKINQILNTIDEGNRIEAIIMMKKFLGLKEFRDSNNALINARNYFWSSIFYFSDKVESLVKDILSKLTSLLVKQEQIDQLPEVAQETKNKLGLESIELKREIPIILENIMEQMKEELSVGYYKNSAT